MNAPIETESSRKSPDAPGNTSPGKCPPSPRSDQDLWKHFATMGATDKNTMTTVTAWLLAFSAAIILFVAKARIDENHLVSRFAFRLGLVGAAASFLAVCSALLYGGYSNWNWAKADEIAWKNGWLDLLPNHGFPKALHPDPKRGVVLRVLVWASSPLVRVANWLSRPSVPRREFAPIFWIYALASLGVGVLSVLTGIWGHSK